MPKKFAPCARMVKSIWFCCQKNYSKWSHRHVESSFHKPAIFFCQKAEFFSLISENDKNTYNFFKKLFLFQGFLWTRRFQFWQSCGKSFDKIPKSFPQKTKKKKIYIFSKKNLIRMFLGHVEYRVLQRKNFFSSLSKRDREKFFSKQFSSKFIYRDVKCSFFNSAEESLPESRLFSRSKSEKELKFQIFSIFLENIFRRIVRLGS